MDARRLFVANLSFEIKQEDLKDIFSEFGTVKEATLIMDKLTGKSRGFGFVAMRTPEEAQRAIIGLHGVDVWERPLHVNVAKPKEGGGNKKDRNNKERR